MSIDDYKDLVSDLPEAAQEALREHWSEIRRAYSPRGIDNYLKGALALHHLGRGEELVTAYVRSMPDLAKSIGEDLLPEVVSFLLGMSSKASGAMLTLIVSSAPKAAVRLSDEDLFRRYLNILSMVLTQAPRGLRPMLENLSLIHI